jgi:hypothetical protein
MAMELQRAMLKFGQGNAVRCTSEAFLDRGNRLCWGIEKLFDRCSMGACM